MATARRDGSTMRRLQWLIVAALLAFVAGGAAPVQAQPQAETARFEIRSFVVEGNSVLAAATVDGVLAPYAGTGRSFADVQAAADALQQAYARAGFGGVQVSLPEQRLVDGVVRIAVVEPALRTVTIEGNSHFDNANIRRSLPALRTGATPTPTSSRRRSASRTRIRRGD